MSHLGCVGSGDKLQKQKKGPWSLGGGKAEVRCLGMRKGGGKKLWPSRRERVPKWEV